MRRVPRNGTLVTTPGWTCRCRPLRSSWSWWGSSRLGVGQGSDQDVVVDGVDDGGEDELERSSHWLTVHQWGPEAWPQEGCCQLESLYQDHLGGTSESHGEWWWSRAALQGQFEVEDSKIELIYFKTAYFYALLSNLLIALWVVCCKW